MSITDIIWLIFLLSTIQPLLQQRTLQARRVRALRQIERGRGSRVITLIHRQEAFSFFGLPFGRYLDIDDSEQVLRAIALTDPKVPIDMVLHTPGGLVLAAEQIAQALQRHPAKVSVIVPHYAMSGGTLIALAADEILLAPSAVLGPVDPQIGQHPAASILAAVARKDVNSVGDEMLVLADVARKAITQVQEVATALLVGNGMDTKEAAQVARTLSEGRWTHDFPIDAQTGSVLGLPVSTSMPREAQTIIRLYPQPRANRPSVEYVPLPYGPGRQQIGPVH
ncbi:MAG TPA: ATP-dependent Clp protease proteolytic subunit [Jatrophihabitans sp.]|nr:ATP-dependent Clp protease proteolytic subunit [Jatrophihabitans sp.]